MDNRNPYRASEAPGPPGVSNNYPQSSYNASRPPHNMSANAANASASGGHASTWNSSQMYFTPPTLPRPEHFQNPPMPQQHQFNQSEPPPPIPGIGPPSDFSRPSGLHPHPGPGLHPPPGPGFGSHPHLGPGPGLHPHLGPGPGLHPHPGPGLHPFPGPGPGPHLHPGPGPHLHPGPGPGPGLHTHPGPGSGLTPPAHHPPPTGFHPPPGQGFTPPPGQGFTPPTGIYPPHGPGFPPPTHHPSQTGLFSSSGPGLTQQTYHPPPTGLHSSPNFSSNPSPGLTPPFTRPNSSGYGVQLSTPKQVHPDVSGRFFREKERFMEPVIKSQPEDELTIQRREDEKWVKKFLESKRKCTRRDLKPQSNGIFVSDLKNALYSTAELVSQLSTLCENLKLNVDNPKEWSNYYVEALNMKQDIESKLKMLTDRKLMERMKMKVSNIAKKRARKRRARQRLEMEEQQREVQKAEKDADIERWRMKRIHAEEEKKKEQELKVAADAVLCEVRKKLTDVKRMENILKSLEKLRKLREEAASRKGIFTDAQSDETFNNLLEEMRSVAQKRTAVYSAEEKALMVMVEGEQEEERRRDLERRRQKERDKQMRKKRKVDAMLFGDDSPADPLMQPFRQYYTQAEHSLPALVQIRREWDMFLVPVDHPEGSAVPQSWVIPDAPSDQAWASALQTSECEDL